MVNHSYGIDNPIEVVETVLEVADLAWNAIDHHRHASKEQQCDEEISSLQSENHRLRSQLQDNLILLQTLSQSPALCKNCPPDLYRRLLATVDSSSFLRQLESLQQTSLAIPTNDFPLKEVSGEDLHSAETMVNVDLEQPSWWVWVTDEMVPSNTEEPSGIDNEAYVIITDEQVVDGVANFIARCILANPKSKGLTPQELQKSVAKALGGMNNWHKMRKVWHAAKLIYAFSTWGLALAGLYRHRAVLKAAANGIGATSKAVLKAL